MYWNRWLENGAGGVATRHIALFMVPFSFSLWVVCIFVKFVNKIILRELEIIFISEDL